MILHKERLHVSTENANGQRAMCFRNTKNVPGAMGTNVRFVEKNSHLAVLGCDITCAKNNGYTHMRGACVRQSFGYIAQMRRHWHRLFGY
jgi:hypothetical protein